MTHKTTIIVWDELNDGLATWDIPSFLLGQPDPVEAVDRYLAELIDPISPDLLTLDSTDEPLPFVRRAFGWVGCGIRTALYLVTKESQREAAEAMAQLDYDEHFSQYKD